MLTVICRRLLRRTLSNCLLQRRSFLSSAYSCEELWEQRKRCPIFQKIDYDDLYHQLDRSFQIGQRVSVLDVDLFVNGLDGDIFQNELEDVLFKLRLNPETGLMSERTMHAVVKYYIAIGKKQELLAILSNRLNYGIFPDYYLSNVLIDQFLKEGDVISAAKVAVLQMLQEDFNHPIMKKLSLLSCYKYLNSSEVWSPPKEPEVDPDEDEVRVRVAFLRNPYFDDHFDLVDTNHLVGKTLVLAGEANSGPLSLSSRLVGLALHEKWSALAALLERAAKNKEEVYEEALVKVEQYTQTRPKEPVGSKPPEETDDVLNGKKSVLAAVEKARKNCSLLPGCLEKAIEEEVVKVVRENESKDISALSQLYREWEKEREQHIDFETYQSEKRKTVQEIAKTRQELQKQEQMIFYFDKEDEWNLKVEQKEAEQAVLNEQEAKRNKKTAEEEYIPPDVDVKRTG